MKLNDRTVTGAKPAMPSGKKEFTFFDDDIAGLGLRLREKGSRTWIFQYWHGGRARRHTPGPYPKLSASAARELVNGVGGLAARVADGRDPAAEKAAEKEAAKRKRSVDTFATIAALFLAAQRKRLKPRSLEGVERNIHVHAKPLHALPLDEISQRDVADLLSDIAANSGPVSANRVRSSISAMLNWAMKAGRAEKNPAAFTNKENEKPRVRVLSADELAKIWQALPEGDYGAIVKLLILTGQRKSEISDLQWNEIDMRRGSITLPPERVKNNRQHFVPLSDPARAIIKAAARKPKRDFVFGYGNGGFSGWSR